MTVPHHWRSFGARYGLEASRCEACAAVYHPPRAVCPACRRASVGNMTLMRLSGRGVIEAATRMHEAPDGWAGDVPYVVAVVRLDEGPRALGEVVECGRDVPQAGTPVEAVLRRVRVASSDGVILYGTKWRAIDEGDRAARGGHEKETVE